MKSGRFLGRVLEPLIKIGLLLMKNVLRSLAKSFLVPLALIEAASAADAGIFKKSLGLRMKTSIVLNEEMDDIMKIVKSLEESGLLIKNISETTKK